MMVFSSLVALMVSQASVATVDSTYTSIEAEEAAYSELATGAHLEAMERLELLREERPDDPAVLINLAAAYIESGRLLDASEAYHDAIASRKHQQLELADGSWADSRDLARMGLARLENSQAWAMK